MRCAAHRRLPAGAFWHRRPCGLRYRAGGAHACQAASQARARPRARRLPALARLPGRIIVVLPMPRPSAATRLHGVRSRRAGGAAGRQRQHRARHGRQPPVRGRGADRGRRSASRRSRSTPRATRWPPTRAPSACACVRQGSSRANPYANETLTLYVPQGPQARQGARRARDDAGARRVGHATAPATSRPCAAACRSRASTQQRLCRSDAAPARAPRAAPARRATNA